MHHPNRRSWSWFDDCRDHPVDRHGSTCFNRADTSTVALAAGLAPHAPIGFGIGERFRAKHARGLGSGEGCRFALVRFERLKHSKPMPSIRRTGDRHFRDSRLVGHAADMPKSARMTLLRNRRPLSFTPGPWPDAPFADAGARDLTFGRSPGWAPGSDAAGR